RQGEMSWVSRISAALEDDNFTLFCQPILPLTAEHQPGIEILIRMLDKKNGGVIAPGAFLPAAERYDLIEKLDRWVVERTFCFFQQHHDVLDGLSYCSINLSGRSIGSEDFLRFLQSVFIKTRVPYNKIAFEVTETAAIQNLNFANTFMAQMQSLGCEFFLDDFGAGMSSFAYLKQLPVNKLKIDGLFVRDIHEDAIDHAMVKSINDVGHAVGMQTIAEFVETDAVLKILHQLGVDYVQGYRISKPLALNDFSVESLALMQTDIYAVLEDCSEATRIVS
ncbi:MAG: EAL domain-containing protein, partial [Cycloclasticus sp.]